MIHRVDGPCHQPARRGRQQMCALHSERWKGILRESVCERYVSHAQGSRAAGQVRRVCAGPERFL